MSWHFKPSPIPPTTKLEFLSAISSPLNPVPSTKTSDFHAQCSTTAVLDSPRNQLPKDPVFPPETAVFLPSLVQNLPISNGNLGGVCPLHASLRSLIQTATGKLRFFRRRAASSRSEAHASVAMEAAIPLRRRPPRQEPPAPWRRGRWARWWQQRPP